MLQEQQARFVRHMTKTCGMPAGTKRRSIANPGDTQPSVGAETAQRASATAENGHHTSGVAEADAESSTPVQGGTPLKSPISLERGSARQEVSARAAVSNPQTKAKSTRHEPEEAATFSARRQLSDSSLAAGNKEVDACDPQPLARSPLGIPKQASPPLRQKREPTADLQTQDAEEKESLIQAVPEVPEGRASLGWPDARKGSESMLPSGQARGVLLSSQQDAFAPAGESLVDSANEADLEALLGQLVNRAEHI